MNLDPTLRGTDRVASLVVGGAAMGYALVGLEQIWAEGVLIVLGLILAMGGIEGT